MAQEVTIVLLAVANNRSSEVGRFRTPVTAAVIVWQKFDGYIHTINSVFRKVGRKKNRQREDGASLFNSHNNHSAGFG